jgi:hypothetical protein
LDSHFDNKVKRLDVDILPALKDRDSYGWPLAR